MSVQGRSVGDIPGKRESELRVLKELVSVINSGQDLEAVFAHAADSVRTLVGAETVAIPILSDEQASYTYRAAAGSHADELTGIELPVEVGVCGWVLRNRCAWWRGSLDQLSEDERNQWEKEAGNMLLVPLIGKQRFLGGISCINKVNGEEFDQCDLDLLTVFAGHVSIAIENAMAFEELRHARNAAEAYRMRLEKLNARLVEANSELQYLAVHDPLTGLPNRALVLDRMEQGILQAERSGRDMALIMIDLDDFKEVNDTLGHGAGDALLVELGKRLQAALHGNITIGRLGGDEFAVLLPQADAEEALAVARSLHDSIQQAIEVEGRVMLLGASMGISIYPDHGLQPSDLMKCADMAMYVAKRNRIPVSVYNTQHNPYNDSHLELTHDLRVAIGRQQITLCFQPKIDMQTRTVLGAEALARWTHPVRGRIPPDTFIPILEQTGLIAEFTLQVLEKAVCYCKQCEQAGYAIGVAVNLSVHNLREEGLPAQVRAILDRHGLENRRLTLEITESAVMDDPDRSLGVLDELASMGVGLSIDDFGTGYSSLGYLKRMPVQELKIDRSFVRDMIDDRDDAVIVRSTIDLAHNLGLRTVAEGVETEEVLAVLGEMGCDLAQGYLVSRPLSQEAFTRFLGDCAWAVPSARVA